MFWMICFRPSQVSLKLKLSHKNIVNIVNWNLSSPKISRLIVSFVRRKVSAFDHSLAKITGGRGGGSGGEERMEPYSRVSTGNDKKKVKNNNENKLEIRWMNEKAKFNSCEDFSLLLVFTIVGVWCSCKIEIAIFYWILKSLAKEWNGDFSCFWHREDGFERVKTTSTSNLDQNWRR